MLSTVDHLLYKEVKTVIQRIKSQLLFSFFNTYSSQKDYKALGVDMHSHLIPGIDDGAKNMEDALSMIKQLQQMGYQKLITTPHIMTEYYPNSEEDILGRLEELRQATQKAGIDIQLEAAAEYYLDEQFEERLKDNPTLLTFSGNHLLIECSMLRPYSRLPELLFQLNTKGYRPVLAHPERYTYYAATPQIFEQIKTRGCLLQVNLLSLTGYYGSAQKKLAFHLFKQGWIDLAGTDLHQPAQLQHLKNAFQKRAYRKILQQYSLKNSDLE